MTFKCFFENNAGDESDKSVLQKKGKNNRLFCPGFTYSIKARFPCDSPFLIDVAP